MPQDKASIAKLTALMGSLAIAYFAPGGLTMILGGIAINMSSQYLYDLFNPKWLQLFKSKDGILNHDIQKALVSALDNACEDLFAAYKTQYQPNARERENISRFLSDLHKTAQTRLLLPDAQNEAKEQELLQYLSFTTKDSIYQQIEERLQLHTTLQDNDRDQYNLSDAFIAFFKKELGTTLQEAFVQALSGSPIAKEKIQWLYFECLQQSITAITAGNTEILEALHQLNTQATRTDAYGQLWTGAIRRFYERFNKLEQGQEKILKVLESLPGNIQAAVKDTLQNLSPAAVIPNFSVSDRYQLLQQQLQDKQQQFEQKQTDITETREDIATMPEGRAKERLQKNLNNLERERLNLSQAVNDAEKELQNFMIQVLGMANTFGAITTTPSQRRQTARALFAAGKFEEANAALNEKAIFEERDTLRNKHRDKLKELAEELLLKGQFTALNKSTPDWFAEATRFYTEAVATHANYYICFSCAYFLAQHNQHQQAINHYKQALPFVTDEGEKALLLNNLANLQSDKNEFTEALANYQKALWIRRGLAQANPQTYLPDVAQTLNNLGILQKAKNEFPEALANYMEALRIYRALAKSNPQTYLPDVALTLNNLAVLQQVTNKFTEALANYQKALRIRRGLAQANPQTYLSDVAETLNNLGILQKAKNEFPEALANYMEALRIYRALAKSNPQTYLPDVATTLNNLASLQKAKNEFAAALANYQEALQIRRALAETNPQTYMPKVADTLNNLANLQQTKNEFPEALANYMEALRIYRELAETNPQMYLPDVAMTATGLSIFYIQSQPNREASLAYAKEALLAALPFFEVVPSVQQYIGTLKQILQRWGIDPQAFIAAL